MPLARIVGGIGRTLISAGLLVLLFVGYQLWGTGLAEARAQDDLRASFEASLDGTGTAAAPTTAAPTTAAPTTAPTTTGSGATVPTTTSAPPTVPPTTVPPPTTRPPAPRGEAVAIIRIPRIGLDKAVVEGVTVGDLKKGPGHYPSSPMPGRPGNAAIAGHRTTYGAPFGGLGSLDEGDEIFVTTREGDFRYVIDRISIVAPSQVEVLDPSVEARITLTTCHPKYSARQRLIVSGVLSGEPAPAPAPAPTDTAPAPTDTAPAATDTAPAPTDEPGGPADTAPTPTDAAPAPAPTDVPGGPAGVADPAAPAGPPGSADDPVVDQEPQAIDDPSLAGDPAARAPAAAWGAATALVALGAWLVGHRWRRWPSYALALPIGAVTLFLCFEQLSRLLPSNI